MRHLWDAALGLFYPPMCYGCGEPLPRPDFCARCTACIEAPQTPLCSICGVPFATRAGADHPCGACLQRAPHFGRARAAAIYDASDATPHPLKAVLHKYKYGRDVSLAPPLAGLLAARAPLPITPYDVIMPVPLHLDRLRWRGFNQAQLLADQLARRARVPVDPFAVQRIRPTRPQVDLDERERRRNVGGAFRVTHPDRVRERRILLVDDVYTTGATVDECSRAILRAGAAAVDVLVLARAVLH